MKDHMVSIGGPAMKQVPIKAFSKFPPGVSAEDAWRLCGPSAQLHTWKELCMALLFSKKKTRCRPLCLITSNGGRAVDTARDECPVDHHPKTLRTAHEAEEYEILPRHSFWDSLKPWR